MNKEGAWKRSGVLLAAGKRGLIDAEALFYSLVETTTFRASPGVRENYLALYPGSEEGRHNSCAADQPSRQKNQNASDNYLKRRLQERSIHVAVTDVTDYSKLDRHNNNCHQCRDMKTGDQERQGMPDAARCGHQASDPTTQPRGAPAR